jgi:methyltransferase (TIGR00027 family)
VTEDAPTGVGTTAVGVAAMRAAETRRPDRLFEDPLAAAFVAGAGWGRIEIEDVEPERRPGIIALAAWVSARTRFLDDLVVDAIASGVRQVVLLGAGLDARAFRLPWPGGVRVFELDTPAMLAFKQRVVDEVDAKPRSERIVIAIDLREDWPAALRAKGFDTHQPTAWSAEGLLPYLPADAQDRLFDNITALSAPGSRLATEHVPDPNAFTDERLQQISDRWRSFGFDLNAADLFYVGERSVVVDYLTQHGWQVDAHPAKELYARNGFQFPEEATVAVFGEMSYVAATLK